MNLSPCLLEDTVRPIMGGPGYVYTPMSDAEKLKRSIAMKRRLGIPPDHVRVYGVHFRAEERDPLKYYARWMAKKRGWDAAHAFVSRVAKDGLFKPVPARGRPHTAETRAALSEYSRAQWQTRARKPIEWILVEALIAEGAADFEVADFLGVTVSYLQQMLRKRQRQCC